MKSYKGNERARDNNSKLNGEIKNSIKENTWVNIKGSITGKKTTTVLLVFKYDLRN